MVIFIIPNKQPKRCNKQYILDIKQLKAFYNFFWKNSY